MLGTVFPPQISVIWLIPAIPLAFAAVNLFAGKRLGRGAGWLAAGAVALSFVLSIWSALELFAAEADPVSELIVHHLVRVKFTFVITLGADAGLDVRVIAAEFRL